MKTRSTFLLLAVLAFAMLAVAVGLHPALLHDPSGFMLLAVAPGAVLDVKDIAPAIDAIKTTTLARFGTIDEKQAELTARVQAVEQKADQRGTGQATFAAGDVDPVGDLVVKHDNLDRLRSGELKSMRVPVSAFSLGLKTTVTSANTVMAQPYREPQPYGPLARQYAVRDLLVQKQTDAPNIEFLRATRTGTAAIQVAEGDQKAELAMNFALATAAVRTIAVWIPASRQVLDDNSYLLDFINTELRDALQLAEDAQLLKGSGTGTDLNGLWTQATAYNRAVDNDTATDTLRRAITQVQLARGTATGIVINPIGLEHLELQKDLEGRYMVTYNVTDSNGRTVSWRVPVVVTDALNPTEFMVGDFGRAARLYDRRQAAVEIATQHADFFTRNLVAILAEERLALTVPRPDMLVKGTFATA